ncbi:MAG: benzoate-CoA ligase family protein [Desulfovibrio sp.]|jgi:benzoate-CoA ligase|nr:benzoate-CoA ligase family protein [Desulfovibrio sp.]
MTVHANTAAELLHQNREAHPQKAAYLCGEDVLTHQALAVEAARFANLLRARGVGPGDRVVLALPDSFGSVKAFLGAMLLSACPVPVHAALPREDVAFILMDSGASALIAPEDSPAMQAARDVSGLACVLPCSLGGPWGLGDFSGGFAAAPPSPDAPGFMLYSSGSTGRPKGVPHAQADLLEPARGWGGGVLGIRERDVFFSASKMSFAYGLISSVGLPLSVGATAALLPGKPGPAELFAAITRYRPTLFFCVPTLYAMLLRSYCPAQGDDLSSLRLCLSAGEALPEGLCRQWALQTGVELLDSMGSTEAFNLFLSNRPSQVRCGSSGQLVPGWEARLVDEAGADVPDGVPGDLRARGAGTCPAYWNRPDKTAESMLPGGWLRTGDMYVRESGFYFHRGRSDDMLKVGAHFVSPVQVEEALREHPAVLECAVAAMLVDGLVRPCAHVVPAAGAEPGTRLAAELLRFARERLEPQQCPVRVLFVDELPRTSTGKVQRFRLRQL